MRDRKPHTLQALILAAGDGDRLYPYTADRPKSLIPLCGRPIINHVLDALFAAGVRHSTIVVGYHGDEMRAALTELSPCGMTIRFVENDAYDTGNARSLWAARDAIDGPFVLAMADHLVEPSLTRRLACDAGDRSRLAIERALYDDERANEATRALVREGRVTDLGKKIEEWNAFDTGSFWCTPRVFDAVTPDNREGELGDIFSTLARAGELDAVDVTRTRWIDIDTEADLLAAELMFGRKLSRRRAVAPPLAVDGVA